MKKIVFILLISVLIYADSTLDSINKKLELAYKQREQLIETINKANVTLQQTEGYIFALEEMKKELQDSTK